LRRSNNSQQAIRPADLLLKVIKSVNVGATVPSGDPCWRAQSTLASRGSGRMSSRSVLAAGIT